MKQTMGRKHRRSPQKSQRDRSFRAGPPSTARKRPVLRFVLTFLFLMTAFYGITSMSWYQDGLFPRYLNLNADVSAMLLRWSGEEAHAADQDVRSPRMALSIRAGCDAIEPSFMFAAAILAFPAALKAKLIGVVVGVTALLLLNFVRIISLYYIGIHAPRWFETAHVDLWQPAYIIIALACWILWLLWTMRCNSVAQAHEHG